MQLFLVACPALGATDPYPLRPVDTSSPRATLEGFIGSLDATYIRFTSLIKNYAASDRLYFSLEEWRGHRNAFAMGQKAVRYMDLSQVSPVLHTVVAGDRAIQLKEIFDRIEIPPFEEIPDHAAMESAPVKRWRLPNTEIEIALIKDGPRAGEYLISAATVERTPAFYNQIRDLPYRPGPAKELNGAYRSLSGNRTFTIYDAYSTSPVGISMIVPPRWLLSLPNWAKSRVAELAVWQWLAFAFGLGICFLVVCAVHRFAVLLRRRHEDESGFGMFSVVMPLAIVVATAVLVPLLENVLRIGGSPRIIAELGRTVTVYLAAAWLAFVGAGLIGRMIASSEQLSFRSLDSQLVKLGARLVGTMIALALLMQGATELGFPAYSVIAGLGIGGLAVALAARESLANLLGSILIMFEKPFRVGHRIRVGGSEGTVEDVGFRSTRIRTLDNSMISLPNSAVINATVENLTLRKMYRQRLVIQLTYDTPRSSLELFSDRVKQLIDAHPTTDKGSIRVHFNDFGESSLNVLVIFHLIVADVAAELVEREKVLLQFIDLAQELGVQFAFPTRTLHVVPTAGESEADLGIPVVLKEARQGAE